MGIWTVLGLYEIQKLFGFPLSCGFFLQLHGILFTLYVLVLVGDSRASCCRVTKVLPLPRSAVSVWDSSFSKTVSFLQLCTEAGLFSEIPFCCDLDVFISFRLELAMESLWWYKELGPWASMWFNYKSGTLEMTATPLQEKMARRARWRDNNQTAIFKRHSGRGCQASELGERKMFKLPIHVVLAMLHGWHLPGLHPGNCL